MNEERGVAYRLTLDRAYRALILDVKQSGEIDPTARRLTLRLRQPYDPNPRGRRVRKTDRLFGKGAAYARHQRR